MAGLIQIWRSFAGCSRILLNICVLAALASLGAFLSGFFFLERRTYSLYAMSSEGSCVISLGSIHSFNSLGKVYLCSSDDRCDCELLAEGGDIFYSLAISNDGTLCAGAGFTSSRRGEDPPIEEGVVAVWNLQTKRLLRRIVVHGDICSVVAFSADGALVVAGFSNGKISVWDLRYDSKIDFRQLHTKAVRSLSFSSDGQWLASGGEDGEFAILKASDLELVQMLHVGGSHPMMVAFSPDSRLLFTGGGDNAIRLWDPVTRVVLTSSSENSKPVNCAAFTRDGKIAAVGSRDGVVTIWDVVRKKMLKRISTQHSISSMNFTSDPDKIILATGLIGEPANAMLLNWRTARLAVLRMPL